MAQYRSGRRLELAHHSLSLFETPFCRLLNALLTVTWHGSGGCGAKRKGLTTAAGIISGMYCTTGDLGPALHSQLAKTDGEVTNLVSCGTSVLYQLVHAQPPRPLGQWGPTFLATGTCNPCGVIFGHCPGVARWFSGSARYGRRVAGGTMTCQARSLSRSRRDRRGPRAV